MLNHQEKNVKKEEKNIFTNILLQVNYILTEQIYHATRDYYSKNTNVHIWSIYLAT